MVALEVYLTDPKNPTIALHIRINIQESYKQRV